MSRAAIRYAKAVLELAIEQKNAKSINADMETIFNTINTNKELQSFISSEVISLTDKAEALSKIFSGQNKQTINMFSVLATNKRIDELPQIAATYLELYQKSQGIQNAQVTTAVPLTDDLKNLVLERAQKLTDAKHVELENIIDESILGGFILRVGDKQYNASIANQLNTLKREITIN